MKAAYINPFLTATIELFERTFGISPQAGAPFIEERGHKHRWDVSGVMVLTGSAIGVVAIRLPRYLADKLLVKSGVQWKGEGEREQLCDGMIGELVNIISGNASGQLTDYDIEISLPIVVQGANHTISWPERAPIISLPFSTDLGPFMVSVSLIEIPATYRN
jgi:chemotaxis protein CheX